MRQVITFSTRGLNKGYFIARFTFISKLLNAHRGSYELYIGGNPTFNITANYDAETNMVTYSVPKGALWDHVGVWMFNIIDVIEKKGRITDKEIAKLFDDRYGEETSKPLVQICSLLDSLFFRGVYNYPVPTGDLLPEAVGSVYHKDSGVFWEVPQEEAT